MWRQTLKTHGFHISKSKTKYMKCKFSKRYTNSNIEARIEDDIIPQVTRFTYTGSIIQNNKEIEGDVNHMIQYGWMEWSSDLGVICNQRISLKLKEKFYRIVIRPTIIWDWMLGDKKPIRK